MADSIGQLRYRVEYINTADEVVTETSSEFGTDGMLIFNPNNTVIADKFGKFTRIGIQAAPGTKVVLNKTHTIIIGRTGLYELEATINHMYFIRTRNYEHDLAAEQLARETGSIHMAKAEELRKAAIEALPIEPPISGDKADYNSYWFTYMEIEDTFHDDGYPDEVVEVEGEEQTVMPYDTAKALYMTGINGIYKLPYPDDLNDDRNYVEMKNIVIDFYYSN